LRQLRQAKQSIREPLLGEWDSLADELVGLLGVAELQAPVRLKVAGKEANVHKRRSRLTATNQEEHSTKKLHCIQEILTPQKRGFFMTKIYPFLCPTSSQHKKLTSASSTLLDVFKISFESSRVATEDAPPQALGSERFQT
jgi:hypothetical protein